MAEPPGDDPLPRAGAGEVQETGTDLRGPARGRPAPQRLWGSRPGRLGVFAVVCGTTVGLVLTVVTDREPGLLLAVWLLASTVVAAFAVRPRAAYMIIPVPALAYLVAAVVAGLIHDRATDTSRTALVISAVQWIANGFFAMTAATAIAIAVAAARWLVSSHAPQRLWRPSPASPYSASPPSAGSSSASTAPASTEQASTGQASAGPGGPAAATSQQPAAGDPASPPGLPTGPRHPA
jgi:hypothetical protein